MRLQWLRDRLHNERGSVLLFTFTLLVFLLVMGGFAMDFAFQAAARTELQRSMTPPPSPEPESSASTIRSSPPRARSPETTGSGTPREPVR